VGRSGRSCTPLSGGGSGGMPGDTLSCSRFYLSIGWADQKTTVIRGQERANHPVRKPKEWAADPHQGTRRAAEFSGRERKYFCIYYTDLSTLREHRGPDYWRAAVWRTVAASGIGKKYFMGIHGPGLGGKETRSLIFILRSLRGSIWPSTYQRL